MSRFAAIAFSGLALESARQRLVSEERASRSKRSEQEEPDEVFAVVVTRAARDVGEAALLGNTRLSEVSSEARRLGICPGQTIAAAKAKRSTLRVRVVKEAVIQAALVTVAEMAMTFGATVSYEAGGDAGDIVWIDVTGCAHLHASANDPEGERTLALAIHEAVTKMGHGCRVAIADGARVAARVARFARATRGEPILVPVHGNAKAMARLPLASLGLSSDAFGWLSKIGARKVGDLQRLPRSGLATRLGHEAPRVMALLEGDDRAPLRPHVPPERPTERVVLEYAIAHHEALFFVVKRLCDRLAVRLAGRVALASKLLLKLEVDHAVGGAPPKDPTLPITLASPLSKAEEIFLVVRAKIVSPDGAARIAIEHEENGTMDVPILAVSLEVTEQVAATSVPQHLFVAEAKAERALPRIVAELSAAFGAHAVGVLSLVDTWVSTERSRLVPYQASPPSRFAQRRLVSEGEEMSRLLPVPREVARRSLTEVRLVARSEQVEWWKPGSHARDSFVAFWEEGGRGNAWVSIERETSTAWIHGWLD